MIIILDWQIVLNGTCLAYQDSIKPKCPKICTTEYTPICARLNGKLQEFGNNCELQRIICETSEGTACFCSGFNSCY